MGNFFRKMVLRSLNWNDRDKHVAKLIQFCQETDGAGYSLGSYFSTKQTSVVNLPGERMVDEDRAFFCSELIAKAYKSCNIMKTDLAASKFSPGDFSQKVNSLKLVEGATLSDEMLVMTDAMFTQN